MPIDLARPETNTKHAGFTPQERDSFSNTINTLGLKDVWRDMHPGVQAYSYWGFRGNCYVKNIGWRLDYFCVDDKVKVRSCEMDGESYDFGRVDGKPSSDHVPVVLVLEEGEDVEVSSNRRA